MRCNFTRRYRSDWKSHGRGLIVDMKRFKKSCEDVKKSTQVIKDLCKAECPIEELMTPIEQVIESSKKKEEAGGVAFEQRFPITWREVNVVKN